MRLVRWCSLVGLLALMACGSRRQAQPTLPSGQKITINDQTLAEGGSDTVRFGHMHAGEVAVLPLLFANESTQPIVILGYDRTCGCTTLEYENQPLKSGEQRAANLRFDSAGSYGWQFKVVKIRLSGSREPHRLYVEAEVE